MQKEPQNSHNHNENHHLIFGEPPPHTAVVDFEHAEGGLLMPAEIEMSVNGKKVQVNTDRHRALLQVLREELGLTGTKYGCGKGQCGACTVLIDGRAARSCNYPAARAAGRSIITIEGLAANGTLHPVQEAFIEENAMQCGYCVPGMILTTVAFLNENPNPTEEDMMNTMNGNICRCCNYPNILAAVRRSAKLK